MTKWLRWALAPLIALGVAVAAGGTPPLAGHEVASIEKLPVGAAVVEESDLAPPSYEREVARKAAELLSVLHYKRTPIDDDLSRRWFELYLKRLDYQRMVFLQSDIDEFRDRFETRMDDAVRQHPADVEAALVIYETYRERMRERLAAAQATLAKGIDLTDREAWVPERLDHGLPWPATAEEADEIWRKRIEAEFIVELLDGKRTREELSERLEERYERYLKSLADTESTDVMEAWLGALGGAFDPHSTWFKPARNDDFDISITNSVTGIGAQLRTEGDFTQVVEVIAGGPADKSDRVFKEDKILAVAQGSEEPVDVVGLRIDKVVKLIRGEVGSEVRLHIEHADGEREIVVLERDRVTIEESAASHSVREVDGKKYGVIKLPSFYLDPRGRRNGRRASADVKTAIGELRKEGVEGILLDLRHNGGGSLDEAIDVTGLFITRGPVVQVRGRRGRLEALHDVDPQTHWLGPLVVLTDPTSASASEIVAGALQDYGRAVIVGSEQTHGKGTVQSVTGLTRTLSGRYDEDVGGALKLTIQKFYRVSGSSTQRRGVRSDIVLPSRWDGFDIYEKDLDYALDWDQIPPAPWPRYADLSEVVPQLQKQSTKRVAKSEDFQRLTDELAENARLRARKEVSLNLEERRAEHEAREARLGSDDEANEAVRASAGEDDEEENDFILDEAVAILDDLSASMQPKVIKRRDR